MMSVFADDAVVIDPHFPTPEMQGKAAITEGFREAITGMRSFGYTRGRTKILTKKCSKAICYI
jgi:ketosteroid isomerase-like protein